MRTKEEITRQREGLEKMKKGLPEYSAFGDNNWANIDAQIDILLGADLGDYEDSDEYNSAEEAEMWLNGEIEEDLFE